MKRIIGAALAALTLLAVPASASASYRLSMQEARTKMRHLVVSKTRDVIRSSITIDNCVRQSSYKIRCNLSFSDGEFWSGHVWSKATRSGEYVDTNYSVFS